MLRTDQLLILNGLPPRDLRMVQLPNGEGDRMTDSEWSAFIEDGRRRRWSSVVEWTHLSRVSFSVDAPDDVTDDYPSVVAQLVAVETPRTVRPPDDPVAALSAAPSAPPVLLPVAA